MDLEITKQRAVIAKAKTAAVFAWKDETLSEYWELTVKTLDWGNRLGPSLLVDDQGNITMMLPEGVNLEKKQEANGKLPDPERANSENEDAFLAILRNETQQTPNKFRNYIAQVKGVSEETTTGVNKLKQIFAKRQLFPAINVNDSVTKTKFDNIYDCAHQFVDASSEPPMLCFQERRPWFVDTEMQEKNVLKH